MDVVVVGAGPTGLTLACELALAGVRCRVMDRRAAQSGITRAFAVHARTLELLDARGLADDLLPRGVPVREITPAPGATLRLAELATRFPMILIAPQSGTERVLEARARELGVDLAYGVEVTGLQQDADGVRIEVTGPDGAGTERARYVVGCDGAHSAVRSLLGIDFVGAQYETHIMLADVRLTAPPPEAMFARNNDDGAVICVPFGDGWFRVIAWDLRREKVPLDQPLSGAEMRDAFHRIAGTDFGMGEPRWSSRFLSERRQARRYRQGRVFLAGDAAHVHSPLGGQGMNTGIQDAMNLGWKLAAAVQGRASAGLLDTYQDERHPVGTKVLALTDAFNSLVLGRSRLRRAVQGMVIRTLVRFGWSRRQLAMRLTGLGVGYRRARGDHAWAGRRMPDVQTADGRLYELLRTGKFLLVDSTRAGLPGAGSPSVRRVRGAGPGLPALLLVRPDGYVAWASDDGSGKRGRLDAAVAHWCGASEGAASATPR